MMQTVFVFIANIIASYRCTARELRGLESPSTRALSGPSFETVDGDTVDGETVDGDILCAFYDTVRNKAQLINWCGDKSGGGNYVNGPCSAANAWAGITCTNGRVTILDFFRAEPKIKRIGGSLPTQLGLLTGLTRLQIVSCSLTGSIPTEIAKLTQLSFLGLGSNSLTSSIPSQLGGLTCLIFLSFNSNKLTGSIPSQLGALTKLTTLSFSKNSLTSSIPSQLAGLLDLATLSFNSNQMTGSIPSQLGGLTALTSFNCSHNRLIGSVPASLCSRSVGLITARNPGLVRCDGSSDDVTSPISDTTSDNSSGADMPTGAIVGLFIGVGLLLAVAVVWCRSLNAKARRRADEERSSASSSSNPNRHFIANAVFVELSPPSRHSGASHVNPILARPNSHARQSDGASESPSHPNKRASMSQDAWQFGHTSFMQAQASRTAMAAAEALIPGVLSIAREFPIIGPCAGVLLQFFKSVQQTRCNQQELTRLKEQCHIGVSWILEMGPRLKTLDSALVEQALRRVVGVVYYASQLVDSLGSRLDPGTATKGAYHAAVSVVLSSKDQDRLTAAANWLRDAITYLLQTVPVVTGMQMNSKVMSATPLVSSRNLLTFSTLSLSLFLDLLTARRCG